jgi:hypothetical protein
MIKNLFRLTALGIIWSRYKVIIVSTALLFFYFWLVGSLHDDFVAFIELEDDKTHLAASFLIKWLAFFAGLVIYLAVNTRMGRKPKGSSADLETRSAKSDSKPDQQKTEADPFAEVRARKKLRSAADFVVEGKGTGRKKK